MPPAAMRPFWTGKATRNMPGEDGSDDERNELERKHTDLIYKALQKLMRRVAPTGTTPANITADDAVQRYCENQSLLRDALVAMLTDGAMLGADVGIAQTEWLMGVGKATTIVGVDWDLINQDVLSWVMGGGFGDGYADALAAGMATTSERQLRTLVGEWIRNDLTYRNLVDDLSRTVFSRTRAEMVSTTEITRAYAEGNRAAWQRGGIITQMRWYTSADERVCPICGAVHGQVSGVNGNFGNGLFPPAHPRCRCFIQPYVPNATSLASGPGQPERISALRTRLETLDDTTARDELGKLTARIRNAESAGDTALESRLRSELQIYFDVLGERRRTGTVVERMARDAADYPSLAQPARQTNALRYRASAEQTAIVDQKVDQWMKILADSYKTTPAEIERIVMQSFNKMIADNPMAMNFYSDNIDKLLEDGRFKTQFETLRSGGVLNMKTRSNAESLGLGMPENLDPTQRPIYGYLRVGRDMERIGYGDVTFVFKEEARRRATITVDDSLANFAGSEVVGTPVTAPTKASLDGWTEALHSHAIGDYDNEQLFERLKYIEVQVQGGVSLSDISHVIDRKGKLTPGQIERLNELGVNVWDSD